MRAERGGAATGLERIGALKRATKGLTTHRTISLLGKDAHRVRTITADNGCEFHDYVQLRQYLPKGTDLAGLTQPQCDRLAEIVNNRPRKRLGYKTPNEVYDSHRVVALQC